MLGQYKVQAINERTVIHVYSRRAWLAAFYSRATAFLSTLTTGT